MEMAGQSTTLLRWKYSHYFEIVEEKEKGIVVKCRLCAGEKLVNCKKHHFKFKNTSVCKAQHYRVGRERERQMIPAPRLKLNNKSLISVHVHHQVKQLVAARSQNF